MSHVDLRIQLEQASLKIRHKYCKFAKEHAWVEHVTCLPKRGVGALSKAFTFGQGGSICMRWLYLQCTDTTWVGSSVAIQDYIVLPTILNVDLQKMQRPI